MTRQIKMLQYPVVNLEVNEILIQLELDRNCHFCNLKL